MGTWESELLEKCEIKPFMYARFVDDIFGIWTGSEETLKSFAAAANQIHPRIQIEMTSSSSQIMFLDVTISKASR